MSRLHKHHGGRDAVQGLGASVSESNDLAWPSERSEKTLAGEQAAMEYVVLHIVGGGTAARLHPIQRDEIYRIACEAMPHELNHASATRSKSNFRYDERQLRLGSG